MNWAACIWLILMVALLAVEASTVTLVSLWFAAGALAALLVSFFGPIWLQIAVFLAVSVVLLLALRPLVRKYITPKVTKTNIDSVVGSVGLVTVPVDNVTASGQVKLGGMEWSARSTTGDPIEAGTKVKVDRIEGVKVFVTPVRDSVECGV